EVRRYTSSEIAERWFCGRCGTPLLVRDFDGETHDFSIATLDRPEAIAPEAHFHYASHIAWAEACDTLPRFPRGREGWPLRDSMKPSARSCAMSRSERCSPATSNSRRTR